MHLCKNLTYVGVWQYDVAQNKNTGYEPNVSANVCTNAIRAEQGLFPQWI